MNAEDILKLYATGERDFSSASLSEANLSGANLSKVNLSGANLSVANLCGCNLSDSELSRVKLNVARLSGANLSRANLFEANLNVANLTLADLSHAELRYASLVRAELARAELSGANLTHANLSGADLKDAKLRHANLSHANLSRADLKWATAIAANLSQANLHGTDLSSSNLSGADLSNTELRQANLSRANLRGANLSGANLRWADLSGADLSWADLSGARLSGANLTGVNLINANLLGTILVHSDLTRASLIDADWSGADLSGATLTGAKLHGVLRFGVKTEGILCEWVDLSPNGDQSEIYHLTADRLKTFFHETPPTVRITIDAPFNPEAHYALAATYYQVFKRYKLPLDPPNIRVGRRRTTLSFEMRNDSQLFLAAYAAIMPFKDADRAQHNLRSVIDILQSTTNGNAPSATLEQTLQPIPAPWIHEVAEQFSETIEPLKLPTELESILEKLKFFHASTQTTLISSSNQTLTLYSQAGFGKRLTQPAISLDADGVENWEADTEQPIASLPTLDTLVEFIQGFQEPEIVRKESLTKGAAAVGEKPSSNGQQVASNGKSKRPAKTEESVN
jgi:uncharacterized protein YjbI with pentapeptide repeats